MSAWEGDSASVPAVLLNGVNKGTFSETLLAEETALSKEVICQTPEVFVPLIR